MDTFVVSVCPIHPHSSDFGGISARYPLFLHQHTMQSSLFEPGCPAIFTCSTGEHVDATMKGPSEKAELFAVLEYMKGGQVVKGIFKGIFKW